MENISDQIVTIENAEAFRPYMDPEFFDSIKEYDTITEMWKMCVDTYGDAPAILDGGKTYSYKEVEEQLALFRTSVKNAHQDPSKRVAVLSPNCFEFVKAYLSVVTLASTAVLLPPQLDAGSVFGCCMKYNCDTLLYAPGMEEKLAVVKSQNPGIKLVCTTELGAEPTAAVDCDKKTGAVVMFTGGTTGKSKGALLSNGAVMQGTVNGCYGLKLGRGERYMLILPLTHVFGLVRNLMTSLYTGSALFICRNNKDMFKDIAVFRPTCMVMVPALAEMALNLSRKFGKNMLGEDLKYIICGAAAVSPYLIREYDKLGIIVGPGYGLTESANLVSGNPDGLGKIESVGLPYPHQQLRIVNGELWLKGENMLDGYIGEPDIDAFENGWFKTGDLVRFDEDGFLYITGRIKEIIILSSGENISPQEVEAKFNELDFVQDSQIFEDVLENGSHILALEVVPRMAELAKIQAEDKNAYMMEELSRVNRSLFGPYQVNKITIRETDFERTPSMKIVRYKKC